VVTSVPEEPAASVLRVEVNQCGKWADWLGSERWALGHSEQNGWPLNSQWLNPSFTIDQCKFVTALVDVSEFAFGMNNKYDIAGVFYH
jgi:hypothetical protein